MNIVGIENILNLEIFNLKKMSYLIKFKSKDREPP